MSEHTTITITERTKSELKNLIRSAFDQCHWSTSGRYVDIAQDLGFEDLVKEMENDQEQQ